MAGDAHVAVASLAKLLHAKKPQKPRVCSCCHLPCKGHSKRVVVVNGISMELGKTGQNCALRNARKCKGDVVCTDQNCVDRTCTKCHLPEAHKSKNVQFPTGDALVYASSDSESDEEEAPEDVFKRELIEAHEQWGQGPFSSVCEPILADWVRAGLDQKYWAPLLGALGRFWAKLPLNPRNKPPATLLLDQAQVYRCFSAVLTHELSELPIESSTVVKLVNIAWHACPLYSGKSLQLDMGPRSPASSPGGSYELLLPGTPAPSSSSPLVVSSSLGTSLFHAEDMPDGKRKVSKKAKGVSTRRYETKRSRANDAIAANRTGPVLSSLFPSSPLASSASSSLISSSSSPLVPVALFPGSPGHPPPHGTLAVQGMSDSRLPATLVNTKCLFCKFPAEMQCSECQFILCQPYDSVRCTFGLHGSKICFLKVSPLRFDPNYLAECSSFTVFRRTSK
eukprot:TRINITY_DN1331_c0_g2_i3.p1 TRINITY_DN1331_c0_g2~~TRINITY_DN1331_c0_g2_i3.p1  ORF type:complete len:451 (-),score=11.62 TRINITY_DN1331_c0_g2_i3:470-1822(-)